MDVSAQNSLVATTPIKSKEISNFTENSNPNIASATPRNAKSSGTKSVNSKKSAWKNMSVDQNLTTVCSPRNRMTGRKVVLVNKTARKAKETSNASADCSCKEKSIARVAGEAIHDSVVNQNFEVGDGYASDNRNSSENKPSGEIGSSTIKRRRDRMLEEARNSLPESGKVTHLVQAFEKLFFIPNSKESLMKAAENLVEKNKVMHWALPGLPSLNIPETEVSSSSFFPSDMFLTSENLGFCSRISASSSTDTSKLSITTRTSNGGRRSRRNSIESNGTFLGRKLKKKQLKKTCQKPFTLRTEERGKQKEEEFIKKIQEMMEEDEKQRIPIAQGLPFTTDEPECLVKPAVKENTRPIDLKLHSDVRAMERAEFDHHVAEKMSLVEQYKMERERQEKLAEEEEIRRIRRELVPKAQPMPYFDRPFIPRRSMKNPTVPIEPKFRVPQHKKIKCCLSWNDFSSFTYRQ